MNDTLNLTGVVATTPRHVVTAEGLAIASFRLASAQRRYNRSTNTWAEGDTNWYTVTAFRQLALNIATSIHRGERVVLSGRLRLKPWQQGDKNGLNVEIDADSIGHDLNWGTAAFIRVQHGTKTGSTSSSSDAQGATDEGQHQNAEPADAWSSNSEGDGAAEPHSAPRANLGVSNADRSPEDGRHGKGQLADAHLEEAAVPF